MIFIGLLVQPGVKEPVEALAGKQVLKTHNTVYLAQLMLSLSVLEHQAVTKRWLKTVMTHYISCCGKKPLVFQSSCCASTPDHPRHRQKQMFCTSVLGSEVLTLISPVRLDSANRNKTPECLSPHTRQANLPSVSA